MRGGGTGSERGARDVATGFMRDRHARFDTPEGVVFDLVARATGRQPLRRRKIVRGYDNEVYAVATRQGRGVIVRIHRHGGVPFRQEAWAMDQCRARGVPAPTVFLVDEIDTPDGPREAMVLAGLPGRPLSDLLPNLDRSARERILAQAGAALGGIHRVVAGGFYRRHDDGSWDFPDADRIMASALRDLGAEEGFILQAGFTPDEFARMMALLKWSAAAFPPAQPVLCHGDFLPRHLLVDDALTLTGVIDFGEFQGGPPIHDFARFSFEQPDLDLTLLARGYPDQGLFDEQFPTRLNLHGLGLQMGHLAHHVRTDNVEEVRPLAARLRQTLDALPMG